ncbi:hypothetical protein JXB02_03265 [Candidatus Woesearchaeota archaeon]|nr:hypothetical protein [Candidatus Woesearchaeota archaeon]
MAYGDDGPIYVRIDEYKEILDIISLLKSKLGQAKEVLGKIQEVKNQEDTELELWGNAIDEIERKIGYIDKSLFEPQA